MWETPGADSKSAVSYAEVTRRVRVAGTVPRDGEGDGKGHGVQFFTFTSIYERVEALVIKMKLISIGY